MKRCLNRSEVTVQFTVVKKIKPHQRSESQNTEVSFTGGL